MPSQSEVERELNQRFPAAEAFVVVDLAARVAMGKARIDQVSATLRDMGYEEQQAPVAAPVEHVEVPPDVTPIDHHHHHHHRDDPSRSRRAAEPAPHLSHRPIRSSTHARASSAAPGTRASMPVASSAGGEHRQPVPTAEDRRLSSAPPDAVARWADSASRNLPSQPISVAEWQGGVAPASSPSPQRTSSSSGHGEAQHRQQRPAPGEEPAGATTSAHHHRAWASPPTAAPTPQRVGESAPSASSPPVAVASPPRGRGIAASPSGGSASGGVAAVARSRTSDPAARAPKPVDAAAADVAAAGDGVILYMTTMTGDRMVRDRVRHFERQLFLHSIPYHPMDVSENRFVRKQIVRMCGGVDRGLPLLFVGDRCVGTYDEVQLMVDDEVFLHRLAELGWTHPDLARSKAAAEAPAPAGELQKPPSDAVASPMRRSSVASLARADDPPASPSLASPLAGSRDGRSYHSRHSAERAEEAAAAAASAPPPPQHSPTFNDHRSLSLSRSGRGPILSPNPSAGGVSTHRPALGGSAGVASSSSPHRHSGGGGGAPGGPAAAVGGGSPTAHLRRDAPLYSPPPLPERRSGRAGAAGGSLHAGSVGAEPHHHARTTWTAQGGMPREDRLQRWHRLL